MKGKNIFFASLAGLLTCSTVSIILADKVYQMVSKKNSSLMKLICRIENNQEEQRQRKSFEEDKEWINSQNIINYYISSRDEKKLHASYLPASCDSKLYVVCIHGLGTSGIDEFASVARFYNEHGVNVIMTDQRCHGESEGEYITYGSRESRDHMEWLDFIISEFGSDIKILIHGVSMGAATAMMMCRNELPKNVKSIVVDSAYSNLKSILCRWLDKVRMPGKLAVLLYQQGCFNRNSYDPSRTNPIDGAKKVYIPILFIHGKADSIVPYKMTEELYMACPSINKKILLIEGADHAQAFKYTDEVRSSIGQMIKRLQ